jgi:hypothetical protein
MPPHVEASAAVSKLGLWVPYSGAARIVLALILLAVAAGVVCAGIRLTHSLQLPRPSQGTRVLILVSWGLSIVVFLIAFAVLVKHAKAEHVIHGGAPADPIAPVTATCVIVTFIVIALASRPYGQEVMLVSAAVCAIAAPMIFEFPFDFIVMARTYPAVPPDPAAYRALFFVPLFLIEIATLAMLTFSPLVRLTRPACFAFALMLVVFAVWALQGFAYPNTGLPIALNVIAKLLCFVTALSLFLPVRAPARSRVGVVAVE